MKGRETKFSVKQLTDPYILLFSVTLFLSAGLTFTIQPMIGKMLLPLVGGTPSGWLITMVYFQVVLLIGYLIAHLLSRATVIQHILVIGGLLLLGIVSFPITVKAALIQTPGLPEELGVLITLTVCLTLPCVALFTLSPSLQRLFKASSAKTSRDPYFLFAASNCGSLGGLLSYPLIFERTTGLSFQSCLWELGYLALIALFTLCAGLAYGQLEKPRKAKAESKSSRITWRQRGWWVLLAFVPSSLMLGVTAHITTDTGAVPFFWVLPLALYLVTFILAFARRRIFALDNIAFLQTASIALVVAFFIKTPAIVSAPEDMLFPLMAFFMTALFCHFTLAGARPPAQKLTEFYLWIAIGGALGGIFNTLIAPFIFPLPIEFIVVALLSCLMQPVRKSLEKKEVKNLLLITCFPAILAAMICGIGVFHDGKHQLLNILSSALLVLTFVIISLSPRLLIGMSLVFGLFSISIHNSHMLDVHRNFFGVLRVFDKEDRDAKITIRALYHGSTLHGQEKVLPQTDVKPNGYYDGPLTEIYALHPPGNVGIVGLGAGTSICHRAPRRHYTIYELDPAVPVMAEKWFDFIRVCGAPKILIGDGRRLLAAEHGPQHDLIIIDAFSSDAIPVHLLTQEAFRVYFSRLKKDGLLAIHISNRFYSLRYPISDVVASLGLHAYDKLYTPEESKRPMVIASRWVIVARDEKSLQPLLWQFWQTLPPPEGRPWTDDFSDTLSALKIMHIEDEIKADAQTH